MQFVKGLIFAFLDHGPVLRVLDMKGSTVHILAQQVPSSEVSRSALHCRSNLILSFRREISGWAAVETLEI